MPNQSKKVDFSLKHASNIKNNLNRMQGLIEKNEEFIDYPLEINEISKIGIKGKIVVWIKNTSDQPIDIIKNTELFTIMPLQEQDIVKLDAIATHHENAMTYNPSNIEQCLCKYKHKLFIANAASIVGLRWKYELFSPHEKQVYRQPGIYLQNNDIYIVPHPIQGFKPFTAHRKKTFLNKRQKITLILELSIN